MRDLDHALTLIDATVGAVTVPVTLKMRLGWDDRIRQRAGACAARRSCGRSADHRAWPHALPVLQRQGRLDGRARGEGRRFDSGGRQRRHRQASTTPTRRSRASGADAVMIGRARAGPAMVSRARSRAISRPARARRAPPLGASNCADRRALRRDARRITASRSACAMRASISAGRSTPPPRRAGAPRRTLKRIAQRC